MMTSTRRAASPAHLALTASGFREPRTCDVKVGRGYYIGASSSPSFVVVLSVADSMVRYVNSYSLVESSVAMWIFADLACSALATLRKDVERARAEASRADTSTALGRLAVQIETVCEERAAAHGAPVDVARFDRFEVRVSAPKGVDVYGIGKNWGVVGDWDHDANEVSVECDRDGVEGMVAAGLKIVSERVVKLCPRHAY
jgi:hypothetical protein